jgi:hypothetical protein
MQRILRIEEILSTRTIEPAQELCALPDGERLRRRVRSLCRRCDVRRRECGHSGATCSDRSIRRSEGDLRATSLYKHQDEQYRLMNTDDHAMIVFDFSPYNATALQLTQEESRNLACTSSSAAPRRHAQRQRLVCFARSFVRCHFHIFATAGGNDSLHRFRA